MKTRKLLKTAIVFTLGVALGVALSVLALYLYDASFKIDVDFPTFFQDSWLPNGSN